MNERFIVLEIEAEHNFYVVYDSVKECECIYIGLFENKEDCQTRCDEMNECDL